MARDPGEVARLGVAWALGSEDAGVMSAVKHFPGHGDTAVDSHLGLPTVDKPRAELERTEWLPFEAAVRSGVGSVMTAHIVYPALDPLRPATLSPAALTGLLRNEWGYGGVIVTDATDMRAIADAHPHGQAAPLALAAGADAVLSCGHGDLEIHTQHAEALERALSAGTLSEARVREALARLDAAAKTFPGTPRPYSAAQQAEDEASVQTWARRALEWIGPAPKLDAAQPVLLFVPRSAAVGGPYGDFLGGEDLAAALRPVFPQLWVALTDDDPAPALELLARFPDAPVLLATTGRWAVSEVQQQLAEEVRGRTALHLALWNPQHVAALGLPAVITHGFRPANLRALAEALSS